MGLIMIEFNFILNYAKSLTWHLAGFRVKVVLFNIKINLNLSVWGDLNSRQEEFPTGD
jgi:hypothetical protein